jgi:hypothetical protein
MTNKIAVMLDRGKSAYTPDGTCRRLSVLTGFRAGRHFALTYRIL